MDGTKLSKASLRAMLCVSPSWGEMRGSVARKKVGETTRSQSDFSEGQKGPYGRSPKKPTVGFEDDLPWVAKTTHSRFLFRPSVEPSFWACIEGGESLLQEADLLLETLELVAQAGRFDEV